MNFRRIWRHSLLCMIALVSLQYQANVIAQVTTGDKLPEALKGVKPTGGVCRRGKRLSGAIDNSTASQIQPDLSCSVSIDEISPLISSPDSTLVDLRTTQEYQDFHIKGALNLSSSDLHSKPYWRHKTVILVGDGKTERELYIECARLKQEGYSRVRVLQGGMPLWLVHHQPVSGRPPSALQLTRLSAAEFWQETQNPDNLVLLGREQRALQEELPFSVVLPQVTIKQIQAVLERRRKELKNSFLSAVILAAAPSINDEQIRELQNALFPIPLLFYSGARDAYVHEVALQKAIWQARARGPKQPGCGL